MNGSRIPYSYEDGIIRLFILCWQFLFLLQGEEWYNHRVWLYITYCHIKFIEI